MNGIDIAMFEFVYKLRETLGFLNPIMIMLAEFLPFLLAGYMVARWFVNDNRQKTRRMLACAFVSFAIAAVLCKVAGVFVYHTQPFASLENVEKLVNKEVGNSFPSDHTALYFSVLYTFFMFSKSKHRFWYIVVAALGGLARVWVGVHYPLDVIVAALIGIISAIVVANTLGKSKILNDTITKINQLGDRILGKS